VATLSDESTGTSLDGNTLHSIEREERTLCAVNNKESSNLTELDLISYLIAV
jgi:hypothetical protein